MGVAGDTVFRPEDFFDGRTEGAAVVRDLFGRIVRRCEMVTVGQRRSAYGALEFDETFTYDDGEVDRWRWVMTRGRDGGYVASESLAGAGIAGSHVGDDYVLAFRRPTRAGRRQVRARFVTRFTLLAPGMALKTVRVSLFGLPAAELVGVHRKAGAAA